MLRYITVVEKASIYSRCPSQSFAPKQALPLNSKSSKLSLSPRRPITTNRILQQNQGQAFKDVQHGANINEITPGERATALSNVPNHAIPPTRPYQIPRNEDRHRHDFVEKRSINLQDKGRRTAAKKHADNGKAFTLDAGALGELARIRVVRGSEDKLHTNHQDIPFTTEALELGETIKPSEIIKTIDAETGLVDSGIVFENIEQLRKQLSASKERTDPPTLFQCHAISQQLYEGFTSLQLEDYISKTSTTLVHDFDDLNGRFTSDNLARSAWFVGSSPFPAEALERLSPTIEPLEGYLIGQLPSEGRVMQTRKQHLVEKVLRQSWRIRAKEEFQLEGEVDVRLKKDHLDLLLNHKRDLFQSLTQKYGAKIDISRSRHLIRITANFADCLEIYKLIYVTVNNISCEYVDLPPKDRLSILARNVLSDQNSIDQLCNLTATLITPIRSGHKETTPSRLRIYYLGPETTGLEDVQKLLFQTIEPDPAREGQVFCETRADSMPVQAPIDVGLTLPWVERATQWTRWRCSLKRKLDATEEDTSQHNENVLIAHPNRKQDTKQCITQSLLDQRLGQSMNAQASKPLDSWSSFRLHVLSANLGSIVYTNTKRKFPKLSQSRAERDKQVQENFREIIESPRVMVPGLAGILETLRFIPNQQTRVQYEICVRLRPIASNQDIPMQMMPDLHLGVQIIEQPEKVIHLKNVRLLVQERVSDLLLPDYAVDIRFNEKTYIIGPLKRFDDRIVQFVEASNFDVWGSRRLITPPRLKLSIPRSALRTPDAPNVPVGTSDQQDETQTDLIDAEYAPVSLDYRSHMNLRYKGFQIRYTTIEGGQSGGQRTEFSLSMPYHLEYADNPDGIEHPDRAVEFGRFYDVVRDFVDQVQREERLPRRWHSPEARIAHWFDEET